MHTILDAKPEGKRPHRTLCIEGKIILEWILGKQGGRVWTECVWLRIRNSGRSL
jgi:hypothetical protein